MKKIVVILTLALFAAACGGGTSEEDAASTTTAGANDDQVLTGDTGATDSEQAAGQVRVVWVPSSLGMAEFLEIEFAEDNLDVTVTEQTATYDETEAGAQAALAEGHAVLVPATIGARLAEAGASVNAKLFESDDPEIAISQLGVWLMSSQDVIGASAPLGDPEITLTRTELARQNTGGGEDISVVGETVTIAADEVEAVIDSKIQTKLYELGGEVVEELAEKYGARVGGSVGAKAIAKAAGPVAAVLDFIHTMYQFEEAASEMIEAESNARIAAYDTGLTAVAMLSDAHTRLCALKPLVISGEVDPNDAQKLVDRMAISSQRAVGVGDASARDLEGLGDDQAAAQISQLIEARNDTLQEKIIELTTLNREKAAANEAAARFISEPVTSILDPILARESADRAIAGALDRIFSPPEPMNTSMHSNGVLTVMSEGETDIIRHGQFWYEPGVGGPGLDDFFPCGSSGQTVNLCGASPQDSGLFTVSVVEFGGPLPTGPTERIYQYGIVFDVDGQPGNNYLANPSFPYDTFDNSDTWVQVVGGPEGLSMSVTDASTFAELETGGRAVIKGNVLAAFMPQAEIGGGPTDPAVPQRATSFWHLGDFGINPPHEFNIDASPPAQMPLFLPDDIVKLNGPGPLGGPPPTFDQAMLDQTHDAIAAGLAGFEPQTPSVDDMALLEDHDACWATAQLVDDPTELGQRRSAYSYDGSIIELRVTTHDSESAARGGATFRHRSVNLACRDALIESTIGSSDFTSETTFDGSHGSVIRTGFMFDANSFESTSGAFFHGDMTVRYSVTGPNDTSRATGHVFDAVNAAFGHAP